MKLIAASCVCRFLWDAERQRLVSYRAAATAPAKPEREPGPDSAAGQAPACPLGRRGAGRLLSLGRPVE